MAGIDGTAKELHAIIQVVVNLNVVHRGAGTDTLEGDAIELVFRVDIGAGITHDHVGQDAGVVIGLVAAKGT